MVTTSNMKIRSQEADCQVTFQFDHLHHSDILYCKPTGGFSCWPCRSSCDDHPHVWPWPLPFQRLLRWSSFMRPCKDWKIGYFCNAKTRHWRPLHMVAVCVIRTTSIHHRTAWSPADMCPGPRGEGNGRAVWEGKVWGERWSLGTTHHSHLRGVFPPCCVPGEVAELSCETSHWACPSGASLAEAYPLEGPSW